MRRWLGRALLLAACALLIGAGSDPAADFEAELARVDAAIRDNPSRAPQMTVDACLVRRRFAISLYQQGEPERASRSLRYCYTLLAIPEVDQPAPADTKALQAKIAEVQARAARELEQALALRPDVARGLAIYRSCALCHGPEGSGEESGLVPQIAGQHREVVIKQLADIRAGNRDAVLMIPYASVESIGGAQAVADVAGYIDTLEIGVHGGKGPGRELELGRQLYAEHCARCHGPNGEGDAAAFVPRIQAQHYDYLVRQFEWIRDGKRRNANAEMVEQIRDFDARQEHAVLDYVSRLEPPPELQAPAGWKNPDFAR